jgi:anti-sigma B factor antagonist
MAEFTVRTLHTSRAAHVVLVGELDLAGREALEEALIGAEQTGAGSLILDLSRLRFCDVTGMGAIVGAAERARADGRRFAIVGARPELRRLFEMTGTSALVGLVRPPAARAR